MEDSRLLGDINAPNRAVSWVAGSAMVWMTLSRSMFRSTPGGGFRMRFTAASGWFPDQSPRTSLRSWARSVPAGRKMRHRGPHGIPLRPGRTLTAHGSPLVGAFRQLLHRRLHRIPRPIPTSRTAGSGMSLRTHSVWPNSKNEFHELHQCRHRSADRDDLSARSPPQQRVGPFRGSDPLPHGADPMVPELGTELMRPPVSAPFRNPRKPASLRSTVLPDPCGRFLPGEAPAFLPSS